MHRTALYQFHVDHGAHMVDFAGWEMPIRYTSIHEEHRQVRTSGGLFDVSHMGRVRVRGRHARRFLERLCTRRVSNMQAGQCRYSLVCNEQGGVRDDILIYRKDDDDFLLVVNASNREKLLGHFEEVRADLAAEIEDQTSDTVMAALQGPKVMDLIGAVSSEIPTLKRYRFTEKNLLIMKLLVSRTGYTGEDGVEVILPARAAAQAMKLLLKDVDLDSDEAVIKPVGLGARDTLRTEAGMPLYGNELLEDRSAMACGVDFAINLDKDEDERGEPFIGQEALKKAHKEGVPRKITGLLLSGKRTARPHMIVRQGDKSVGEITSACLSPTLERPIAMAILDVEHTEPGTPLTIDTGKGAALEAVTTALPFYKAPKKK